jgi:hypothetical protein
MARKAAGDISIRWSMRSKKTSPAMGPKGEYRLILETTKLGAESRGSTKEEPGVLG